MIASIRHKGLKRLYEDDDPRGVKAEHVEKLLDILARLDAAGIIADMDLPGFKLHPLKGDRKGFWAITVRANWRVIFASKTAKQKTWIISITIEGGSNHADEESPAPWRLRAAPVH